MTPRYSRRHDRLNRLILEFMSEVFEEARGKYISSDILITVTEARLNPAKTVVKIWVRVDNCDQPQKVVEELRATAPFWRHLLSSKLRHHMRLMPEVRFDLDTSPERFQRVEGLLRRLRETNPPPKR